MFKKKLEEFQTNRDSNSIFISLKSIPKKDLAYYRYYREVQIANQLVQFVLPLYEQAKFEEQKMVPVLQVIDYPQVIKKKVFPPRTTLAGAIACALFFVTLLWIIISDILSRTENPKIAYIRKELFNFKSQS